MSFDWSRRSLRLGTFWFPSIGAGNNKVTSFDWALAEAKSCPSIGQRQQQGPVLRLGKGSSKVLSFDWEKAAARSCPLIGLWQGQSCILRLGAGTSEVLSFDWAKAAANCILRLGVRTSEVMSFDCPGSQCVAKPALLPSLIRPGSQ